VQARPDALGGGYIAMLKPIKRDDDSSLCVVIQSVEPSLERVAP